MNAGMASMRMHSKRTTAVDEADMNRMGKVQLFQRSYEFTSIAAFSVVAIAGWCYTPGTLATNLANGGTGGLIVMFLVNWVGLFFVVLSLAEMSSVAPTAGGQYHWASELAPPRLQKLASYLAGWLSCISWTVGFASAAYLIGLTIQGLILVNHPDYVPQPWQAYLLVVAVATFSFSINTAFARILPHVETLVLVLFTAAFIGFMVIYWGFAPRLSTEEVFTTFTEGSGWDSLGLSMLSGQSAILFLIVGSDATAHMAEETKFASQTVPKAMIASYIVNGGLSFTVLVTYCFLLVDYSASENSPVGMLGLPHIQVLINSINSVRGGTAVVVVLVSLQIVGLCNWMASTGRQVFAFARDRGIPFGSWVAKVDSKGSCPINSLVVVYVIVILVPLISLGSTIAFDALTSLQAIALVFTYLISTTSMIWRRFSGKPLRTAPWTLGRAGPLINVLGWCYCIYLVIFLPWPVQIPVTAQNFNWASVMFVGVMLLACIYFVVRGRKAYKGPVVYIRDI